MVSRMSSYFPNRWPLLPKLNQRYENIHMTPTAQNFKHQDIKPKRTTTEV